MAEDDSSPPKPKDWSLYEKPYYTIARVVRYWCELPDDYAMKLDRQTQLPLPDPKYPMVKVRTDLLKDATERGHLPYETPGRFWVPIRDGFTPWSIRALSQDALKGWFSRYRWPERPPFLFWREDAALAQSQTKDVSPLIGDAMDRLLLRTYLAIQSDAKPRPKAIEVWRGLEEYDEEKIILDKDSDNIYWSNPDTGAKTSLSYRRMETRMGPIRREAEESSNHAGITESRA